MKRFLRRFEKLENISCNSSVTDTIKISKRFDRLEIGDKKIEVAITDKIIQEEQSSREIVYYLLCPYCGNENVSDAKSCVSCSHDLQTKLPENYQRITPLLKKCSICKAMNLKERANCWVCGREFFVNRSQEPNLIADNVITLNIDGKEYKSTDIDLPLDVSVLMKKIRRQGYKKEMVEEWVKKRNEELELQDGIKQRRLTEIRYGLFWRILGAVAIIVFVVFRFSACENIMRRY